ncbi:hypothetical protein GCM10010462_20020 [Microbacterium dextranolyticum]|uniref:Uncharacterized protein n=1 Tax=Microbacterium dextranolyticum TaxID=36806 RepID=A0A9W6M524_9MICO|nr:hypothetical protein GCM10017591_04570 [Microbacterium dextranolyticum]
MSARPGDRFVRSPGDDRKVVSDRTPTVKQVHRWEDDGGATVPDRLGRTPTLSSVWTPPAMSARLCAHEALDSLPFRTVGIYADARSLLARIVRDVEQRRVSPEVATEQLRHVTARLIMHREALRMIREAAAHAG